MTHSYYSFSFPATSLLFSSCSFLVIFSLCLYSLLLIHKYINYDFGCTPLQSTISCNSTMIMVSSDANAKTDLLLNLEQLGTGIVGKVEMKAMYCEALLARTISWKETIQRCITFSNSKTKTKQCQAHRSTRSASMMKMRGSGKGKIGVLMKNSRKDL